MKTAARFSVLALLALSLLSTGCVYRSFSEGSAKYTSMSFATAQGVAPFVLEVGKEGSDSFRKIDAKGLTNDPAAAAVEAAVSGAVKAALTASAK
jgi:hypothetical protein